MTYDTHGRLVTWIYGDLHVLHVYDDKSGYLTEKKIGNRATYRFIYKSGTKVTFYPIFHLKENKERKETKKEKE